ncbi:MAG TPA: tRNA guanosine(34) transglycosylase Tgt [Chloroflexota bacterium]|nr:tRNA guanosine(34) transglycosylase Tgt [Chloroflexota bacterium]
MFDFTLQERCAGTAARTGVLTTPHGPMLTPAFMPVGTQATVKSLSPDELRDLGAQCILSNSYHLHLRPGSGLVAKMGGLHRFMGWDRAILTDSGGFQVFSLAHLRRISEDGVAFRSHIDGSEHFFSPESVMRIEEELGADIIMAFDECAPYPAEREYVFQAMERTHRWAERCLKAHTRPDQALFGIVQGGTHPDLREQSSKTLSAMGFKGFGIGGLSVGEPKEVMYSVLEQTTVHLPEDRPRYLMGVGSPEDLVECVARGVDMFDCVLPTRIARNGALFTHSGRLNIRNARYQDDPLPIEEGCGCYCCRNFSRAYLRHLIKSDELLGLRLTTIHNVHFLLQLAREIRASISNGSFPTLRERFLAGYTPVEEEARAANRAARAAAFEADRIGHE